MRTGNFMLLALFVIFLSGCQEYNSVNLIDTPSNSLDQEEKIRLDERCNWWQRHSSALKCDSVLNAGYYYNNDLDTCEYYDGDGGWDGCNKLPFTTIDECTVTCINNKN